MKASLKAQRTAKRQEKRATAQARRKARGSYASPTHKNKYLIDASKIMLAPAGAAQPVAEKQQ